MSPEYYRRGRNWYTAMGVMFIVIALVALIRQMIVWSPDFAIQFLLNNEITSEKFAVATICVGLFFVILGFRKKDGFPR
jgi:hypothetical protein